MPSKIRKIYCQEKIDTQSAMGRFFLNITASLAQMERDLISERTKDALRSKINRGERAGQVLYGWKLGKDGNTLIAEPQQQQAITLIRQLRKQGHSLRAICAKLSQRELLPLGQQWHPQTIANILKRA